MDDYNWQTDDMFGDVQLHTSEQLSSHIIHERKPEKRRYLAGKRRQELSEIMPNLPPPDVDYYIIATGRGKKVETGDIVQSFGFGAFVDYITRKLGGACIVYISTWSMNRDHALMLPDLLDSGLIAELHLLCDPSLLTRKHAIAATVMEGIARHLTSRFKSFKNHAKIMCIKDANEQNYCTITGSANLSGTPRAENYTVSTDPELYRFFINQFFEVMF
ncbi:MAG TPA: hypothetical protein ENI05_14050 [Porticoccus sp.]|nr:hypothetical protein [Porticoccus sp.]